VRGGRKREASKLAPSECRHPRELDSPLSGIFSPLRGEGEVRHRSYTNS
jgi:hypothetical protein